MDLQDRLMNELDYDLIKKQVDAMDGPLSFGSKINVLMITDRLHGCANGLKEYLLNSDDIKVDLVNTLTDATKILYKKPVDFLIIVGYLRNSRAYEVVQEFKRINKYSSVIIYARADGIINDVRVKYGITFVYDRKKPIEDFVSFMSSLYEIESQRLYVESKYRTRYEERNAAMQAIFKAREAAAKEQEEAQDGVFTGLLRRFGWA